MPRFSSVKDSETFLSFSASKPNLRYMHNINDEMKCEVLFSSSLWRGDANLKKKVYSHKRRLQKKSYLFLIPNQTD